MINLDKYRWFLVEPVDAWFFRDGRPSNQGEDQSDLESFFPPAAPTVVGAMRAALARANGWSGSESWSGQADIVATLGDGWDDLGQTRFCGPLLAKRMDTPSGPSAELLWPLPHHVVGSYANGRFEPQGFLSPSTEVVYCDCDQSGISLPIFKNDRTSDKELINNRHLVTSRDTFVTTRGLNAVLQEKLPTPDQCWPASSLFVSESRVGISRDEITRATGTHAMYNPNYVRLCPGVCLVQGVWGIPSQWRIPSLMPLGGESRLASLELLKAPPEIPRSAQRSGDMVISLAPSLFSNQWWGAGPGQAATQLAPHLQGKVVTAAIQRPDLFGGWDFKQRASRPLMPYAPSGSVWWLSEPAGNVGDLLELGFQNAMGFGLAVVG